MALGKQAGHDLHQQHCLLKVGIYAVASQTDDLQPTYTPADKLFYPSFAVIHMGFIAVIYMVLFLLLIWFECTAAVAGQTDALYCTDMPNDNKQGCHTLIQISDSVNS